MTSVSQSSSVPGGRGALSLVVVGGVVLRYCLLKVTGEAGSGGGIVASAGQDADRLSVAVLARRSLLSARSGFAAVVRAGAGAAVTGLAGGTAAEVTVPGAAQGVGPVRLTAAVATSIFVGQGGRPAPPGGGGWINEGEGMHLSITR